ncbi:MAG: long-chain-fatty-acid--CoA ligase [Desulfarculus sp.]|nr:long-chain-fatty-acid--CoA ligase [Desulfarculus sp.]
MTVGDMLTRAAAKFPHKTAVICGELSLTYRQFNQRVNRLAQALLARGLQKGDRLGLLCQNTHQFLELYFAAAKTGGIICPYNNLLTPRELTDLVNYSGPRFLLYGPQYEDKVKDLVAALPTVEHYISLGQPAWDQAAGYEKLLAAAGEQEPQVEVTPQDVMSIYFTSGTTGNPKGAMRTHNHLVTTAYTGVIENKIGYDERVLVVTPMYHVSFEDNIGRCFLVPNTTVIYPSHFEPAGALAMLDQERITCCLLVPTMINAMVHSPAMDSVNLSALKRVFYVGAPMPVELLKKSMKTFGRFGCGFCQQYGATETGPLTTILLPEDHLMEGPPEKVKRLASAGRAVLDYQVRAVDPQGQDVAPGQVGELVVKGEAMMKGYWQMPEASAERVRGGWLYTGDMGYLDDEGYVFIVDRKNDLIISGGKNIYPREVEEVLYEHPAVLEATVVGVPDDYWGEAVRAVVVLKEGMAATPEEIIAFCGQRLAGYKKPKTVELWQELPKSASGKLLRRKVRDKYWEDRERKI